MAEIIVVTSGKGGVGKTTTTANLGVALALLKKKVLLIDTDLGLRNLDVVMGLEDRVVYDLVDVMEGVCAPEQAIIADSRVAGLFLLPAAQMRDQSAFSPKRFSILCDLLREDYDYIVVDSPAGIEKGFQNAIVPADKVVVVATPEMVSIRDADRIVGLLESADKKNVVMLINRIRPALVKSGDMLNPLEMIGMLSVPIVGVIPEEDDVLICANHGRLLCEQKKSVAWEAFLNAARRLNGESVPMMKLLQKERFWNFKKRFCRNGNDDRGGKQK